MFLLVKSNPRSLIHSDVWGHAPMSSHYGYLYYVTFIDDYTRFTWIFPLKHKSNVFVTFMHFKTYIETALSTKIKRRRTSSTYGGHHLAQATTYRLEFSKQYRRTFIATIHQP